MGGAAPKSRNGTTDGSALDANTCSRGITVSEQEMAAITITGVEFHGVWNDTIRPGARTDTAVDS